MATKILTRANMYLCIVPKSGFIQLSYSQHIYVRWEFHTFYTWRKVFLQRFCHCTCGFRVMKKNESGICIIWTTYSKPQLLNILAANSLCFTCVKVVTMWYNFTDNPFHICWTISLFFMLVTGKLDSLRTCIIERRTGCFNKSWGVF